MRKTLFVNSKRSNILDITEDDTSFKLAYSPEIRIQSKSYRPNKIRKLRDKKSVKSGYKYKLICKAFLHQQSLLGGDILILINFYIHDLNF